MFEAHTGVRTWFLISDLISHSRRFVISFGLFICQSEQQRASCHPFELEPAWEWHEWSDIKSQTSQEISDLAERQHSPRTTVLIGAFKVSCTSELNRSYPPWLGNPSLLRGMREQSEKEPKCVRIMLNLAPDDCAGLAGLQDRIVCVRLNSVFPYRRICSGWEGQNTLTCRLD